MKSSFPGRLLRVLVPVLSVAIIAPTATAETLDTGHAHRSGSIPRYQPRLGRVQPVIAVLGENTGSEITDLVIPASLLRQSGKAEVLTVSLNEGLITLRPSGLRLKPDASTDQFDSRFPGGADYVIVPAIGAGQQDNPKMLQWLRTQQEKGATLMSICDGGLVLASAGVLKGKRATAHWFTDKMRRGQFPDTKWEKNIRYVADGKVITTAGISASIPASLALVEAIGERADAARLGKKYGVLEWSSRHNSEMFELRFGRNFLPYSVSLYLNGWFKSTTWVGVPMYAGIDELELALTMDAYSRTGRSKAIALAVENAAVTSASGMVFLPAESNTQTSEVDVILPRVQASTGNLFDRILDDIAERFGSLTATGVAHAAFEYEWAKTGSSD